MNQNRFRQIARLDQLAQPYLKWRRQSSLPLFGGFDRVKLRRLQASLRLMRAP